jgi:hypothetical protein
MVEEAINVRCSGAENVPKVFESLRGIIGHLVVVRDIGGGRVYRYKVQRKERMVVEKIHKFKTFGNLIFRLSCIFNDNLTFQYDTGMPLQAQLITMLINLSLLS